MALEPWVQKIGWGMLAVGVMTLLVASIALWKALTIPDPPDTTDTTINADDIAPAISMWVPDEAIGTATTFFSGNSREQVAIYMGYPELKLQENPPLWRVSFQIRSNVEAGMEGSAVGSILLKMDKLTPGGRLFVAQPLNPQIIINSTQVYSSGVSTGVVAENFISLVYADRLSLEVTLPAPAAVGDLIVTTIQAMFPLGEA